jgi:DNA repair exonuclease SbcCD nuclease subunit
MAKVALLADLHFGVPGKLRDILWGCRVTEAYCTAHGIDTVFILGDLFHDRRFLDIEVFNAAYKFFDQARRQHWIAFPGNHDMYLKHSWDVNSIYPLEKVITVINDIQGVKVHGRTFWIMPFVALERAYMKLVRSLSERINPEDVLLTHIGMRSATLNACFLLKDWSLVDLEHTRFSKVFSGHFHVQQQVGSKSFYVGSLVPFKFDEEGDHGFIVYDTDTGAHEFVNLWEVAAELLPTEKPAPQFYTVLDSDCLELIPAQIQGHCMRVTITQERTEQEKNAYRQFLMDAGAKTVRWLNLTQAGPKVVQPELIAGELVSPARMFDNWLNGQDVPKHLDRKFLLKANSEIVADGEAKYVAEHEQDE